MGGVCKGENGSENFDLEQASKAERYLGNYQQGNDKIADKILDDSKIGRYQGTQKILLIVKIQGIFRSQKATKRVEFRRISKLLHKFVVD
jgi:hypothetical protein